MTRAASHQVASAGPAIPVLPGFDAPAESSQRVFKSVLTALSFPGRVLDLPDELTAPEPLSAEAASVLLSLADGDTPVWLDAGAQASSAVASFLTFHTGAPLVCRPKDAAFGLVTAAAALPPLDHFALGSDEAPDKSATVVVQVGSLAEGLALRLTGPGIPPDASEDQTISVAGLPDHFLENVQQNHRLFPRGVDIILTAPGRLAALPRTIWVEAV